MQYLELKGGGPVDRFFEFSRSLDTTAPQGGFTYLADYLAVWLEESDGAIETGRNFETWLKTALYAANAVLRDPSVLDYRPPSKPALSSEQEASMGEAEVIKYYTAEGSQPRQVEGIFDPGSSSSMILDRHYYEYRVALQDHQQRQSTNG